MRKALLGLAVVVFFIASCSKSAPVNNSSNTQNTTPYTPPAVSASFAKGADVSWVTQMEQSGYKFYDKNGNAQDLFALMKSIGFNSIRLRAWVNPSSGWCNTADVLAKAIRAKNAGMKLLLDFHYSDTWADPGHQAKPAAWASLSFANLENALSTYTVGVMDTLKNHGITPDWAQVGNEIDDGMLWNAGLATDSMANLAGLIETGYKAIKSVSSSTLVVVHHSNGYSNSDFRWLFDGLKANGAQWDIIGMSLYPSTTNWQSYDQECLANINDMISRYGTPCMVVEVGMEEDQAATTRSFLTDLITKVNSVAAGNGLGVFYWEPEAYSNWQSYGLGAFQSNGQPSEALDAFGN